MPIWPFKKRRRNGAQDKVGASQPLTEKANPEQQQQPPARASTYPATGPTSPIAIPRKSSNRGSQRKRRASPEEEFAAAQSDGREKGPQSPQKENLAPPSSQRRASREDITALPMSRRLDTSPHLRPVDMERPHIPYNFRPYSDSKTSIQPENAVSSPPRPNTLKKQRSTYSNGTPNRRRSSRKSKRNDPLREEEIRAMSAQMPIPKRPGDGPLRQDSKKARGFGLRDSNVSLPPSDSVQSGMASIVEQRGWEIGSMDMFNPRPAVRLSNVPQYVTSNLPEETPLLPESPKNMKQKEKMTTTRDEKKRETIGNRADDLDASDLRLLLERDAKRREKRKKEQQEKLDRKLRDRGGRNRGDSDKKRREAKEQKREEEARQRAEEENRERQLMTPPTDVHPALRDRSAETADIVGLGIGEGHVQEQAEAGAEPQKVDDEEMQTAEEQPQNPFTDDAASQAEPERFETPPPEPIGFSPVQTPMEDPVLETAQAIRMSQTNTPPLSPVHTARATSSLSQMIDERRASDMPLAPPPPIRDPDTRRSSDPKPEPRAGAWATFFRRGGTNLRKPNDGKATPSENSFSNTSRESMRNQPLPAHLVDPQAGSLRRKSGTPVRTQSKFREDLPEMPISPPDSRMPSPDVTTAAAAAAAARRGIVPQGSGSTDPDLQAVGRNDTPISPSVRSHRMMSASMASVDSEASWLASGSKRHSTQSGLRASVGSLSRSRPELSGSYEELGGDRDAEYVQRMSPTPDGRRTIKARTSALAGASPDEASEYEEAEETAAIADPLTVHRSVRRQPTLVKGNPRMKSREGLLAETGGADPDSPEALSATTGRSSMDFDPDIPEPQMQRATSVDYGRSHARQISSGSAKLLDLPPKRQSTGPPAMPEASSSKL